MDPPPTYTTVCFCGRSFPQPSALTNHQRGCQKSKRRFSSALDKAKELWRLKKQQRATHNSQPITNEPIVETSDYSTPVVEFEQIPQEIPEVEDSHLPLLERRSWTKRIRRVPFWRRDDLPEPPPALPPPSLHADVNPIPSGFSETQAPVRSSLHKTIWAVRQFLSTAPNKFGVFRRYHAFQYPSHDPEENLQLEDLSDILEPSGRQTLPTTNTVLPYPNESSFLLGEWFWNGGVQKSLTSFKDLVDIIGDPQFNPAEIRDTGWDRINKELGGDNLEEWMDVDAGWTNTPVSISVPFHTRRGYSTTAEDGPKEYVVSDFWHRNLVDVIREKLANTKDDPHFHYEPFELRWKSNTSSAPDTRLYGELYTSPAFIEAHHELQESLGEPGCSLQRVIVAMMFWSDATHLTSFGNASLTPLYLFFGNESKYRRCSPSHHLCSHVAYFQKLPDAFKDFSRTQTANKGVPNGAFGTHCYRELMHEQWKILLDDEFIEAWIHGIVVTCCDGIQRRFYPRIFTYSADYPEKILMASIRNLGNCPCPRCLIPLSLARNIGMVSDMRRRRTLERVDNTDRQAKVASARSLIYKDNLQVTSAAVERKLFSESLVPTSNAFSERLAPLGFNMFTMFVVDLMHEWEIGVGKNIFIHLLRILDSLDKDLLAELDSRFRQVPSFGSTIRNFRRNCSEMKQMAARDIEDILQCAIPVFEGLLPEPHNKHVLQLLFIGAHWHSLAKLRMHTDETLILLDDATTLLGDKLRKFNDTTCKAFHTKELRREMEARDRREAKKKKTQAGVLSQAVNEPPKTQHSVTFNMETYKVHALGDYAATIRRYGTTDSYTTEPGELEHRVSKGRYPRTSKKVFLKQLTQIERRQTRIRRIRERIKHNYDKKKPFVASVPDTHYNIAKSQNDPINIPSFIEINSHDPAIKGFVPKLRSHLLPRIKALLSRELEVSVLQNADPLGLNGLNESPIPDTSEDCNHVLFKGDRMYTHNVLRINYTTYDLRRAQDIVNPNTSHCDIMVLADPSESDSDGSHRFWYGRVLGIYHVNVIYTGNGMLDYSSRRFDFLWVRWFQQDITSPGSWTRLALDGLEFPPVTAEGSFDFVDPDRVLRACHIIPRFSKGRKHFHRESLSKSVQNGDDWDKYVLNRFADRDIVMRYHWGLAVGHLYSHQQEKPRVLDSTPEEDETNINDQSNLTADSTQAIALIEEQDVIDVDVAWTPQAMNGNDSEDENPVFTLVDQEDWSDYDSDRSDTTSINVDDGVLEYIYDD